MTSFKGETCACLSRDPFVCIELRYGSNEFEEECECPCHDGWDEYFDDESYDRDCEVKDQ